MGNCLRPNHTHHSERTRTYFPKSSAKTHHEIAGVYKLLRTAHFEAEIGLNNFESRTSRKVPQGKKGIVPPAPLMTQPRPLDRVDLMPPEIHLSRHPHKRPFSCIKSRVLMSALPTESSVGAWGTTRRDHLDDMRSYIY